MTERPGPPKPRHLQPDQGLQFAEVEVASAYRHRPPYAPEVVDVVLELLGPPPHRVLELGAGSGDFTTLLADRVDTVVAVEPSEPMRALGEQRTVAAPASVTWEGVSSEDFRPDGSYSAAVAAESLHWMDWEVVLPMLAGCLREGGPLAVIGRGLATTPPWAKELQAIIDRYSTNVHYREHDLIADLESRGLFERQGDHETEPTVFRQPLEEYVESFHSRNGFSRARMTPENARAFDQQVAELVAGHVEGDEVELMTVTSVTWGRPRLR
ncbi:MAG: class I SAM-dependent methyltransferase [Acidobacteriota bacterium]